MSDEPALLFRGGDERCRTLCDALLEIIHERAASLPMPLILGVLRIVEHQIIQEHLP
jgi:hypothetical protein